MVAVSLVVNQPVEAVFDYFIDFRNENEWNVVAHDVSMTTPEPIAVGSRFRGVYDRMGQMEYEVKELDRPRFARVRGNARLFAWDSTFTFTTTTEGTSVECTMDPQPKGPLRILKPLMAGSIEKQMRRGLASLTTTLEAKAETGYS
jgi:hypothetical protein